VVDEMMHPGRAPGRRIILSVDADTHGERLSTVLAVCKAADFAQGIFAFTHEGWLDRPLLGRANVTGTSGARFEIDPGAQADERIPIGADESFSAIAPRVVEARQRGHTVVLAYCPTILAIGWTNQGGEWQRARSDVISKEELDRTGSGVMPSFMVNWSEPTKGWLRANVTPQTDSEE
jgi:hypothetical protein